jgi:hypothetical protein
MWGWTEREGEGVAREFLGFVSFWMSNECARCIVLFTAACTLHVLFPLFFLGLVYHCLHTCFLYALEMNV